MKFIVENSWGICFLTKEDAVKTAVPMHHCPWCGTMLASDKRELTPSPIAYPR